MEGEDISEVDLTELEILEEEEGEGEEEEEGEYESENGENGENEENDGEGVEEEIIEIEEDWDDVEFPLSLDLLVQKNCELPEIEKWDNDRDIIIEPNKTLTLKKRTPSVILSNDEDWESGLVLPKTKEGLAALIFNL